MNANRVAGQRPATENVPAQPARTPRPLSPPGASADRSAEPHPRPAYPDATRFQASHGDCCRPRNPGGRPQSRRPAERSEAGLEGRGIESFGATNPVAPRLSGRGARTTARESSAWASGSRRRHASRGTSRGPAELPAGPRELRCGAVRSSAARYGRTIPPTKGRNSTATSVGRAVAVRSPWLGYRVGHVGPPFRNDDKLRSGRANEGQLQCELARER